MKHWCVEAVIVKSLFKVPVMSCPNIFKGDNELDGTQPEV